MINKNISNIKKNNLCMGCGACIAICPNEAIKLIIDNNKGIYIPKIDLKECNECSLCYEICPGQGVDFNNINRELFKKQPKNPLIGNYLNCYVGHSTNYNIRYNSSSGGLITQILIFALEEGIIDGALVTRMKKDNPLEPDPFVARNREEIIEASKSKYCPVPLNFGLKEILKSKNGEKFAVVGLPCHIHGIRKAEKINRKLKEKIELHMGIFCGMTPNFLGTKFLLDKYEIKEETVKNINYRGNGWPGSMSIELNNNDKLLLNDYWDSSFGLHFFTPNRCLLCNDGLCELADISFGDPWITEFSNEKIGKSIIITRTKNSEKILKLMNNKDLITLNKINPEKIVQSQQGMLYFKKKLFKKNSRLFKSIPKYIIYDKLVDANSIDLLISLFPYINSNLYSNAYLKKILPKIPSILLKLYGLPYFFLVRNKSKKDFKKFL
jgi:coenzyme F420 hydrogenase subunit beta